MAVRDAVKWGYEKSSAYGFLSHNNIWGADSTAHIASRTLYPGEGYVITKATALNNWLMANVPQHAALLGPYPDIALEICHNIIEEADSLIAGDYMNEISVMIAMVKRNMIKEVK